jgi:hypothetical protein
MYSASPLPRPRGASQGESGSVRQEFHDGGWSMKSMGRLPWMSQFGWRAGGCFFTPRRSLPRKPTRPPGFALVREARQPARALPAMPTSPTSQKKRPLGYSAPNGLYLFGVAPGISRCVARHGCLCALITPDKARSSGIFGKERNRYAYGIRWPRWVVGFHRRCYHGLCTRKAGPWPTSSHRTSEAGSCRGYGR